MVSTQTSFSAPGLSPEARLLLLCAGGLEGDSLNAALESCLSEPFDWNRLLHLSGFHKQHALLYHRLASRFRDRIPPQVLDQIQQEFVSNQWRNLNLLKELHNLLHRFSERGIACVPFKGPLWAQSLYENLALRWIADLDLMIHPEDIQSAKILLQELGYQPDPVMDAETEKAHIATHWEYGFRHTAQSVRWNCIGVSCRRIRLFMTPGRMICGIRRFRSPWGKANFRPFHPKTRSCIWFCTEEKSTNGPTCVSWLILSELSRRLVAGLDESNRTSSENPCGSVPRGCLPFE